MSEQQKNMKFVKRISVLALILLAIVVIHNVSANRAPCGPDSRRVFIRHGSDLHAVCAKVYNVMPGAGISGDF